MLGIPAATAKATALQLQAENRSARTPAMVQQQSVIDDYTKAISGIVTAGQKLDSLKKASDVDSINFVAADVAKSDADEANRKANTIFDSNRENPVIQALHAGQISALSTTYALYKQFSDARALGAPQHCINVGESPVHITLKANRKPPSDLSKLTNGAGTTTISESSRPLRPIGDVVGIDVEPVNDKQFEILPVGIITFAVPGAKTFYLDAAKKVQEKPDKGAYFPSAGAVAAFRLTRLVWVGAAAAKGQSGTPDSFVGFLFRNPSIARFFVLGVGAGFASVPTELQGGATLNNELPPSADLSKVIKKSIHVGLSIVVAMTGLSLSK